MFYFMEKMNDDIASDNRKQQFQKLGRKFYRLEEEKVTNKVTTESNSFRVLQWNVLADALSESSSTHNFIKVDPSYLKWSHRKELILNHIQHLDGDIISLQEIDHYYDDFYPVFKSLGYEGIFHPKIDSPCFRMPDNNGPDGVALFYRKSKFSCIHYSCYYMMNSDGKFGNQPVIIARLCDTASGRTIIIATTHFKAKKGFEQLRLQHSNQLIAFINNAAKLCTTKPSIIICGDFNGESSEDFYNRICNDKDLNLNDAYGKIYDNQMPFTTWKIRPDHEVKHTIDYIWYSKEELIFSKVLLAPEDSSIPETRYPSIDHPSDHLLLCCDFKFNN